MRTLIIYDNTGHIFVQISGTYVTPQGGVQYLEVDSSTNENKIIKSVNVETKELVLEDIPKTELQLAQEQILAAQAQIASLQEQILLKQ